MASGEVLVVGSINFDLLVFQERMPMRGETVLAGELREEFGGKGANQAVQAARLGQTVAFVGALGVDRRGRDCRENLLGEGVACFLRSVEVPTGLGLVHVVGAGEVYSTVLRGANDHVDADWVGRHAALFAKANFVLVQNEIPGEAVAESIGLAASHGAKVLFNAAPARPVSTSLTRLCHYLIVNEEEAMAFLGRRISDRHAMERALPELKEYCSRVIVTMGAEGSLISFDDVVHHVPAVSIDAVDTTGAGDSFVGAFAAGLNEGLGDLEAANLAATAAALTTSGAGAQTRMPRREDVWNEAVRATAPHPGPGARR